MRRLKVALIALAATGALVVQSCDGSSPTEAAARVDSIRLTPASVAIVKDQQATLVPVMLDSTGAPVAGAKVTWESLSPDIVSVSRDGAVLAKAYGSGVVTATVGTHSAQAAILVTAPPTTAAYAVTELSPTPTQLPSRLTDSALVLAGDLVYRNGVGSTIPGCTPIDINNKSHLLCFDGKGSQATNYSIWSAGVSTPLAATDTFKATVFYPGNYTGFPTAALNDSDVVLGGFYEPAFSSSGCPSGGKLCIVYWKDGQPIFPGVSASDVNWQAHLNNRLDFTVDCLSCSPRPPATGAAPLLYLAATHTTLPNVTGVNDINDVASMAIGGARAEFATPTTRTTLGYGAATGINNANTVVGTLTDFGPFLWSGAGVSILTHAATDPSWTIVNAHKINNHGQILARADNADGRKGVWLILTPTH
jgi:hypothetical protein